MHETNDLDSKNLPMPAVDSNGRTIWIADAHRGDGKRFVVRAGEKLTAFVELESAICAVGRHWLQRLARRVRVIREI
jgi:hypothetical protein